MLPSAADLVEEHACGDAYVEAFDAVFQRDADHLVVVFDLAGAVSFVTNNEGDLFRQFCEGFVVVDAVGIGDDVI